ncbi:MAG: hypothetical protein K0Q53_1624 [Massilibacillus sp.]|jgi:hypothetical protein|nr:hypothetical protein [Massilibacillus sp.]
MYREEEKGKIVERKGIGLILTTIKVLAKLCMNLAGTLFFMGKCRFN